MKKKLFSLLAVLPMIALPSLGAQASTTTTTSTWACTAPAFAACSFSNDPGWDEYNNTWNNPAMPPNSYTLNANSHSDWNVVANQAVCPTSDCAVETYESAQFNYLDTPGSEEVADISHMTSHFSETMPTGNLSTNGFDAEAAYDVWLDNYAIEVMIWVDNQGQTPAGSVIATTTLSGNSYRIYRAGSTYSFVLEHNETSGQVNIQSVLDWLVANNYIASTSYLTQFNFGWEICSTDGQTDTFTVHGLNLIQGFK